MNEIDFTLMAKAGTQPVSFRYGETIFREGDDAGLVQRLVSNGYPPAVLYGLTAEGEELLPPMDALVRTATRAT